MKSNQKIKKASRVRVLMRTAAMFFALFFILSPLTVPVSAISSRDAATPKDVGLATDHIGAAYLYNIENDFAALSYKIDETIYPASTVKIMTGLIAI